jgi:hypothetical protein
MEIHMPDTSEGTPDRAGTLRQAVSQCDLEMARAGSGCRQRDPERQSLHIAGSMWRASVALRGVWKPGLPGTDAAKNLL